MNDDIVDVCRACGSAVTNERCGARGGCMAPFGCLEAFMDWSSRRARRIVEQALERTRARLVSNGAETANAAERRRA